MRTRNYIITSKCCVGTEFAIIISNILTLRSLDPCLPRTNIERKETYWLTGCFRSLTMQTTLTMLQKSSTTIRETNPSQMKQTGQLKRLILCQVSLQSRSIDQQVFKGLPFLKATAECQSVVIFSKNPRFRVFDCEEFTYAFRKATLIQGFLHLS